MIKIPIPSMHFLMKEASLSKGAWHGALQSATVVDIYVFLLFFTITVLQASYYPGSGNKSTPTRRCNISGFIAD
jgi:hypothetical protein